MNKEKVVRYIQLVESLQLNADNAKELLHADYQQWELPNLLNKNGQKSDLADSLRRMELSRSFLKSQTFKILHSIEQGNTVVVEADWAGSFSIDAGPLKKDQVYKARFCMIFEFQDGRIHRVRNYDCFEAF